MALHAARTTPYSAQAEEFLAVLTAHYQMYPALTPQDVYKLLYQRVFGPEHSMDNLAAAKERLYLEVLHLPDTVPTIPLLEPLSPALCRINLQPLVHRRGSVETLWQALKQTARAFQRGTLEDLQRLWQFFLASSWAKRSTPEQLEQFWQQMATVGFPPVHHSRAYTEVHAPHYRVIFSSFAQHSFTRE